MEDQNDLLFENEVDKKPMDHRNKKIIFIDRGKKKQELTDELNKILSFDCVHIGKTESIREHLNRDHEIFIVVNDSIKIDSDSLSWIRSVKEYGAIIFAVKKKNENSEHYHELLSAGIDDLLNDPVCFAELNHRISVHNRLKTKIQTIKSLRKGIESLEEENSNKLLKMYNDLQLAYKELELKKKELESLDKAKSDFIKIVSHEIRSPLSGIIGFSQLLESKLPNEYNNYLGSLNQSAQRLQEFSNKAILISKIKTKSYHINREPVSVVYIVNSILEKFDSTIKEKKLNIRNSITHRIISTDFKLCERAFIHIIENAIRYATEGSSIFFEELYTNDRLSIMIIDQGPGFSEEVFSNLFGLFAHGENYIDKNVGLGLYMVNLILNYLGGNVKVSNNKEGGAMVKLIFPV